MFGFSGIKMAIIGVILGIVGTAAFLAYDYYNDTQAQLEQYAKKEVIMQTTIEDQKETISQLQVDQERFEKLNRNLEKSLNDAEQGLSEVRALLARHNLEELARQKPGLIEKRINDATAELFDELESITAD